MKKNKNYVDLKDQPVPEGQHLLEVDDLKMYFHTEDGVVRAVTPVPGGVGALTTAVLAAHTAKAAARRIK